MWSLSRGASYTYALQQLSAVNTSFCADSPFLLYNQTFTTRYAALKMKDFCLRLTFLVLNDIFNSAEFVFQHSN